MGDAGLGDMACIGFFGHHKCGTTTIQLVLKCVCEALGLRYQSYHSPLQFDGDLPRCIRDDAIDVVAHVNAFYDHVAPIEDLVGFHVVRDPRDLVVSGYFSHLYSHPTEGWPALSAHRKALESVSKSEGILLEIDFESKVLNNIRFWNYSDPRIQELRFETMALDPDRFWRGLFDALFPRVEEGGQVTYQVLNRDLQLDRLLDCVRSHSFERLAGQRQVGEEDPKHHYRKGLPGDWRNHFGRREAEYFAKHHADLLVTLGYEKDDAWVSDCR